jgi:hypothetical protein
MSEVIRTENIAGVEVVHSLDEDGAAVSSFTATGREIIAMLNEVLAKEKEAAKLSSQRGTK